MAGFAGFPEATLSYLERLADNNDRAWFNEHKAEYERLVREPALALIEAIQPDLASISPHFRAIPKKVDGSLMRVYRDTRFSKDKTPYKTNIGIQFRHERGKDVHAPGFYLHVEAGNCFVGAGIWRPESKVLAKIRDFILDNPTAWKRALKAPGFHAGFALAGESLKRAPRGFPAEHELIEDLKRKDFIALKPLADEAISRKRFVSKVASDFRQAAPLMSYLCTALELEF